MSNIQDSLKIISSNNCDKIKNHSEIKIDIDYCNINKIEDHCAVLIKNSKEVKIIEITDHCIITGKCDKLIIKKLGSYNRICITGSLFIGSQGDYVDLKEYISEDDTFKYRTNHFNTVDNIGDDCKMI